MAWCMGASKSNLSNAILSKPVGSVGREGKKKPAMQWPILALNQPRIHAKYVFWDICILNPCHRNVGSLAGTNRTSTRTANLKLFYWQFWKPNTSKDRERNVRYIKGGLFSFAPSQLDQNSPKELRKSWHAIDFTTVCHPEIIIKDWRF